VAALQFQEQIFATRHAVDNWRERVKADGPSMKLFLGSARRARPATLAEIRAYKRPEFWDTCLVFDDELGVVLFLKRAGRPPDVWAVVTVLKIGGRG
jgi:hypothetical protein